MSEMDGFDLYEIERELREMKGQGGRHAVAIRDAELERSRIVHFRQASKIFGDWMVLTDEMVDHIVQLREFNASNGFVHPGLEVVPE